MDKKELLNFCIEKKIVLDNDLLNLFSQFEDLNSIKDFIESLKKVTQKNFITRNVLTSNKEVIKNVLLSSSNENLRELTIKLGLNLEISAKTLDSSMNFSSEKPKVKITSSYNVPPKNFEVKDFVKHFRSRFDEMKKLLEGNSSLESLVSINKITYSKQNVSIIGMVYHKSITKNKNIILEVEDFTGKAKLLINRDKTELYEKADNLPLDAVLGFKCSGNKDILFVNDIILPESHLALRKKAPVEEYAAFIGDFHFGSKNFMKKEFLKFIDYLNGNFKEDAISKKIKYLFLVGDIVTGVGNYPDQEKDLEIKDLESQFSGLAEILSTIRKDIQIIISPGNHDGVRLMEPQPLFDEKYAWSLYELENVILVGNPSYVNIGEKKDFLGFDVLIYHGFSYPYYANNISKLTVEKSMNSPEKIMEYLLTYRHLAPTHGSVQYYPSEKDNHLIRKIPDIFVSGHTHKSGVFYSNNILLVSISSWESLTPYQEKFGNEPDHCKVPLINLKTRAIKILDFEESNNENSEKGEEDGD